jgi:hypothetical protein
LVTLPLGVLTWLFPFVWPLAAASLLLSVGVCTAAAIQSELPPAKHRLWSRPLVAILFFLQPLERGLARYRLRFERSSTASGAISSAELPAEILDEDLQLSYWSKGGVERYRFLGDLTGRLEARGFQIRLDSGWADFDMEISGTFWSRLRLTTVTEELGLGRRNFHCRLCGQWSLAARLIFWSILIGQLVVVVMVAPLHPWVWMLPLTLPFAALLIDHHYHQLKDVVTSHLDASARKLKLVRITRREGKSSLSDSKGLALAPPASTTATV